METFLSKFKTWWIINDLEEVSEVMSVAITVTTGAVLFLWVVFSLLTFSLEVTGLIWIIRGIVILAVLNTLRMYIRDERASR